MHSSIPYFTYFPCSAPPAVRYSGSSPGPQISLNHHAFMQFLPTDRWPWLESRHAWRGENPVNNDDRSVSRLRDGKTPQ